MGEPSLIIVPGDPCRETTLLSLAITKAQYELLRPLVAIKIQYRITHRKVNGHNYITFTAEKIELSERYFEVVPMSDEQWDQMRSHFMTARNSGQFVTRLAYLQ